MDQRPHLSASDGAIAVFVKTPGLSPVKTRLSAGIGKEGAESFYRYSIKAIESVVKSCVQQRPLLTPYWAVAEEEAIESPLWKGFQNLWQGEGDLGDRLFKIYNAILERHRFAILIGADSPQMPVNILVRTVDLLDEPGFVVGNAADGGFYLFGGQVPVSLNSWKAVPYSQSDTAFLLRRMLAPLNRVHDLPELSDVDTIQDLKHLAEEFEGGADLTPEQLMVWEWILRRQ
jgi:glycosyltransferase A (GT-A) superfamily protein (DUF2064 family)